MSDEDWKLMEIHDPFKVTVCSILKNGKLTDDTEKLSEIESFKNLSCKIPAVITTNYDNFLESEIFTKFNTLVYPDDYYFSGSEGYGEILKIHGTIENPDSIVLTAEDYERLRKESKVIMSRLTYLLCYHPVIFLGYSLRDEEIHDLIYGLISSLKQTDIDKIRGHLIRVRISEKLEKSIWNPKIVEYDGKTIEVTDLDIPTPEILFRYLNRFTPVASPVEIMKYKDMIRDIVLSTDPSTKRLILINEDRIESMGPKNYAVIFGDMNSINSMMKGLTGYDISDVLRDVLTDHKGLLDSSEIVFRKWATQTRVCSGDKFIPLFHYYLKYDIDYRTLGKEITEFTDHMAERIESKIEAMSRKCSEVRTADEIDDFLSAQVKSFSRCEALMYFQSAGVISREECRNRLLEMYERGGCVDSRGHMKTDIRCAISHLDMKEYEIRPN